MGIDSLSPTLGQALDFLVKLYDYNLEYSVINTARSALSSVLCLFDSQPFGKHDIVTRFMRGVYNKRPPRARYLATVDVLTVLAYLRTLSPVKNMSLKDLTLTLCLLLALVSGQDLSNFTFVESF